MALKLSIREGCPVSVGGLIVTITKIHRTRVEVIFDGPREIVVDRHVQSRPRVGGDGKIEKVQNRAIRKD